MTSYLLFTLAAPMTSYGAVAVGERRPTWDRPAKSAVLGLIAAALGIPRTAEQDLSNLAAGLGYAVRVDDPGVLASDYHTAQVPPARRNRRFATRAEELAVNKTELKTILSQREFRTGGLATVAVWKFSEAGPTLKDLCEALKEPRFALYAGRKAHPFMLPLNPQIVKAPDVFRAYPAFDESETEAKVSALREHWGIKPRRIAPKQVIYADAASVARHQIERVEERRDIPLSRAKWRFELRGEAVLRPLAEGGGEAA